MAVCFWYLVKSDLTNVQVYNSVCHFVHGTRNTRPCINGHPVFIEGEEGEDDLQELENKLRELDLSDKVIFYFTTFSEKLSTFIPTLLLLFDDNSGL